MLTSSCLEIRQTSSFRLHLLVHVVTGFVMQREIEAAEFFLFGNSQANYRIDNFDDHIGGDQRVDRRDGVTLESCV